VPITVALKQWISRKRQQLTYLCWKACDLFDEDFPFKIMRNVFFEFIILTPFEARKMNGYKAYFSIEFASKVSLTLKLLHASYFKLLSSHSGNFLGSHFNKNLTQLSLFFFFPMGKNSLEHVTKFWSEN